MNPIAIPLYNTSMSKHVQRTTDRSIFKSCRQKWHWTSFQRENYVPVVTPRPLEFGTALHEAWATYYDPDLWSLGPEQKQTLVEARFLTVIQEQKSRYFALQDNYDLPWELEQEFEERKALGLGMLRNYVRWAPTVDNFTPVKVEVDFEVPITNPDTGEQMICACHGWPVFYQGRIDGIVRDIYGGYWILEHKTAGQFMDDSFLVLDDQCTSYAWALAQIGVRVRGILYNEALKDFPEPPQMLKSVRESRRFSVNRSQRTTYDIYLKTIQEAGENIAAYADFLEFLREKGNGFFRRTTVYRNDGELEIVGRRIYDEACDQLNPDLRIYPNPNRFSCMGCSFRQPCIAKQEGTDHEFILNESGLYSRRETSPVVMPSIT